MRYVRIFLSIALAGASFSHLALAESHTEKFFDSAWSGMGFVLGYGDHDAYVKYACGGTDPGDGKECDGPPEAGLIARFDSISASVVQAVATKCSDIPTTGTTTVKAAITPGSEELSDVEVTFATPKQSIPDAWDGAGLAFDRRLEFTAAISGNDIKVVTERSCKQAKTAMAAMNMSVGTDVPGFERQINLWSGTIGANAVGDVYVSEVKDGEQVRGAYAFSVSVDSDAKTYQIWGAAGTSYDGAGTSKPVDQYNLTGNYKEHTSSLRVKRFVAAGLGSGNGGYLDQTSLEGIDGSDVGTLPAATTFDLLTDKSTVAEGASYSAQGCVDFDKPDTAPTSADACEDLDWSKAPTPVLDADGAFSAKWAFGSMHKKLLEVPSL